MKKISVLVGSVILFGSLLISCQKKAEEATTVDSTAVDSVEVVIDSVPVVDSAALKAAAVVEEKP
ncbi:MAG: hypothetical protein JXQ69_02000, partial [Paludibacteraceae bacterium]|nr:hypothetical protein [Paludibacteraceae bacterium]